MSKEEFLQVRVVRQNAGGSPEEIEFIDGDGKVCARETYSYDAAGRISERSGFDESGSLRETETWTYAPAGGLDRHELRLADGSLVYREQWTRDVSGKLLFAESWHFQPGSGEARYRKFPADSAGRLYDPRRNLIVWGLRVLCWAAGIACMFTMMNAFAAGKTGLAVFAGLLMLFNFWNGVKKR